MHLICRRRSLLLCLLFTFLTFTGCSSERPPDNGDEVAQELKLLRQEMAIMREAITEIHRNTMASNVAGSRDSNRANRAAPTVVKEVSLSGDLQSMGSPDAKIGIVEFSDFQCPYCARHHKQTFPALKAQYIDSGKVRYFFRNYPLGIHAQARMAAIAADCAGQQNAFVPMMSSLFENFRSLSPEIYGELADRENLDKVQFRECLSDDRIGDKVDSDFLYAQTLGVNGTPTFFVGVIEGDRLVNVRRLVGAQSAGSFASVIEEKSL